jgi:hypothetical protein
MATNIDKRDVNRFRTYAGLDTSPESNMNWGDIATEVSKGIGLIKKDRENRKAAIDQAQVDQLKALSEVPDLNNRSLNGIIIDGSDSSKQVTVNMYNELKKGNIKVKDFMLFMQNQKNGYSSMSSAVKNYDGWYTKAKERLGTDENGNIIASDLNIYSNETIDGFGNLNNKKLVPNPINGQLQLVTMLKDKNGNYTIMPDPNKNPNNFQNPNAINVRMNFEEDRKVLSDQAAQLTDSIAKKITSRQFDGSISSIEDFRQASVFGKWKKDSVASLTSSDNDSAQILTQSGGYKFAGSIEEFREKHPGLSEDLFIKVDTSGDQPLVELTEEQREVARGYADTAIESQLDQIEKIQTPTRDPDTPSKVNQKQEDIDDIGYIKELDIIMHGNPLEAEAALKRRIDTKNQDPNTPLDEKIVSFEITEDQIILRRAKGDPLTIDRIADTGVVDDPNTPEDESVRTLSNLDDVVAINDLISPNKLSRGRIEDLIKQEGITLGKRRKEGVGSKVGKSEIPAISSGTLNPVSNTSIASDIQTTLNDTAAGDTNNKIKGTVQKAISTHMPQALQQELNDNPSLYGPTTIKKDDTLNEITITIAGEETIIPTSRSTTSSEIADKITEAINKARKKVNENRTSSKLNKKNDEDKPSYAAWKKDNPGGSVKDWKKGTGR